MAVTRTALGSCGHLLQHLYLQALGVANEACSQAQAVKQVFGAVASHSMDADTLLGVAKFITSGVEYEGNAGRLRQSTPAAAMFLKRMAYTLLTTSRKKRDRNGADAVKMVEQALKAEALSRAILLKHDH